MILGNPNETLYKKGDKSEHGNGRGISLISLGSKLLSMMILFRHNVEKVLREELCGFWRVEDASTKFSLLG